MRILVVDDDRSIRQSLLMILEKDGFEVTCAENASSAIQHLKKASFDLILSDLQMPQMSGLELLDYVKQNYPDIIFMMITAFGTTSSAIQAMKKGAFDYILKPFQVEEVLLNIKSALKTKKLEVENSILKREMHKINSYHKIVGNSSCMQTIFKVIENVSKVSTNVLITGESGTGKEMVARAIHNSSPLKDKPFVTVNCGAIPIDLIESEMFGHKKGAFTGAHFDKIGLFEAANGGTLFLDEVAELPLNVQVKLLRVLQERTIRKVGAVNSIKINIRLIAATNRILEDMVKQKKFREDLFYRLNVILINLPSLRERLDDVPALANFFLKKYAEKFSKNIATISGEAMKILNTYNYPGNVRELENIIERAIAMEQTNVILPKSLGSLKKTNVLGSNLVLGNDELNLEQIVESIEKELLIKAIEKSNGIKTKAAKILGISFRSMRYRLNKYGISDVDPDIEEAS